MGTIKIEEYEVIGGKKVYGTGAAPVPHLKTLTKRTVDATTSTSAENITLQDNTNYVVISAAELHRVSLGSDTTGDNENYAEIPANTSFFYREFAVDSGDTLYYRADA